MTGRRYELQVTARYDYTRPVSDLRQRLMVVPRRVHGGLRRGEFDLRVRGVRHAEHTVRRDQFGNVVIDVRVPRIRSHVRFELRTSAIHLAASRSGRRTSTHAWLPPSPRR